MTPGSESMTIRGAPGCFLLVTWTSYGVPCVMAIARPQEPTPLATSQSGQVVQQTAASLLARQSQAARLALG